MKTFTKKPSSDSFILTRKHYSKKLLKSRGNSGPLIKKKNRLLIDNNINILVIGSGGREHALVWKIIQSKMVNKCYVWPGNGGTRLLENVITIDYIVGSFRSIVDLIEKYNINLVVIGPEKYLERGLIDYLKINCPKVLCFGPTKNASKIEWSKAFSKEFMYDNDIPTANYQIFHCFKQAKEYLDHIDYPIVIKASGLANGKGVSIVYNYDEGIDVLTDLMINKKFDHSGSTVIIEEYLQGEEISLLGFTDSINVEVMPLVKDHKKLNNYNRGPNTGGMGAYCYGDIKSAEKYKWILQKVIDKLRLMGIEYKGILYAGLIINNKSVNVLEFNARFGDPETQVLMLLLKSDLVEIMVNCCLNSLNKIKPIKWLKQTSLGVVLVSDGYPNGGLVLDQPITFNSDISDYRYNINIFHSGTKLDNFNSLGLLPILSSNGGRIIMVCCVSFNLESARSKVYQIIDKCIHIPNCNFRIDIGQRPLNIIVFASGNGTNLKYLLNNKEYLPINIIKVITNHTNAGVIPLCHFNNIKIDTIIKRKTESKEVYDDRLINSILSSGIEPDIIMLTGWMRILNYKFINKFKDKIYNVHPSLLPKFAGGMDLDVHNAVLKCGETETGCTIHLVDNGIDTGRIIIQKSCSVYLDKDTPIILKNRVQKLEGECWMKLIYKLLEDRDKNYLPIINYTNCGVNLNKYSKWIDNINDLMKDNLTARLGNTKMKNIMSKSFDNFGSIVPLKNNLDNLVVCTDGVGTKLIMAKNCDKLYNLGIDLVAMCINDLYCCGGYPLVFVDYLGLDSNNQNSLNKKQKKQIIKGIIDACTSSKCFLLGGETAEMSDVYRPGLFDLVGTAIGQVSSDKILPKKDQIQDGDLLLGFPSNGIHSNGFSLIRKIMGNHPPKFISDDLLQPTKIYTNEVEYLHNTFNNNLKALVHVTGGGIISNINRVLPNNCSVKLFYNWKIHPLFNTIESLITSKGCDANEMWNVFNMGLGLIAIIDKKSKIDTDKTLVIGTVISSKQD